MAMGGSHAYAEPSDMSGKVVANCETGFQPVVNRGLVMLAEALDRQILFLAQV